MNDMDWQQVDKETVEALTIDLEAAYKQIRDLAEVISAQNETIAIMRQRFKDHGITVVDKSISEITREQLIELNKTIPEVRFKRAKNPNKMANPHPDDYLMELGKDTYKNMEDTMTRMIATVTAGVDLDKHGIDPETLKFKEGYGPQGRIIPPAPPKLTILQRIKRFFTS